MPPEPWSTLRLGFCCGSMVMNPPSIHEDVDSIPGLAQKVKDNGIAVSCGVGQIQLSSGVAVAVA